ncbi:MAG: hypothetical protein KF857_08860 [Fimbriimonadaceae bacterium]|nr:hypothetical protein [Fimbriimonadaceae bacterium]
MPDRLTIVFLPSREEIKQAARPALSTTIVVVAGVLVAGLLVQRLGVFVLPALAVIVPGVWVYEVWQVRAAQGV